MIDTVTSKKYVTFDSFANISDIFRDESEKITREHIMLITHKLSFHFIAMYGKKVIRCCNACVEK